jgi:succinyl-diaminopimelate desuccinylase
MSPYQALDQWIDQHFDEQVQFLQELIRVPTDSPPGNNTPHALRTAELLKGFGMQAESFEIPAAEVHAHGLTSITDCAQALWRGSRGGTQCPR